MKNLFYIIAMFILVIPVKAQKFALKSNLLYDVTTSMNLGMEIALGSKYTLELSGNYNPWQFADNKKLKHWMIQPELRYWTCEKFHKYFWGVHLHYADYNAGGIKIFGLKDYRYEGYFYGGGITYGYQWILKKRWSMEAVIGVGYAHLDYDKYECHKCGDKLKSSVKNYFGPTKISLGLIYVIK